ncbi:Ribosome-recycling factor [Galdieria sulphuraria]|nr:Ribosome-recycling factor [Galdieria sulphuraria]
MVAARNKKTKADKNKKKDILKELSSEELLFDPQELASSLDKTVTTFQSQLATIRTGFAHPAILDRVTVEAYGTNCSLKEVAQVTQKDAKTLRVQVFDPQITSAVDKAIRTAGLGLNPQVERPGILSVPIPRPDQETRTKLVKEVTKQAETARKALRSVRNKVAQDVKKTNVSEDEQKLSERALDDLVHQYIGKIDSLLENKKTELERT